MFCQLTNWGKLPNDARGIVADRLEVIAGGKQVKKGLTLPPLNFTMPTKENPLMNVLVPQIQYDPERNAAAPSFNPVIEEEINKKTQDFVVEQFDNDERIKKLLFRMITRVEDIPNTMKKQLYYRYLTIWRKVLEKDFKEQLKSDFLDIFASNVYHNNDLYYYMVFSYINLSMLILD